MPNRFRMPSGRVGAGPDLTCNMLLIGLALVVVVAGVQWFIPQRPSRAIDDERADVICKLCQFVSNVLAENITITIGK